MWLLALSTICLVYITLLNFKRVQKHTNTPTAKMTNCFLLQNDREACGGQLGGNWENRPGNEHKVIPQEPPLDVFRNIRVTVTEARSHQPSQLTEP